MTNTWKIEILDYRDIAITHQFDTRGEDFGTIITIDMNGTEWDFNTLEDARKWIDDQLDTDWGFDPVREWGITVSRAC